MNEIITRVKQGKIQGIAETASVFNSKYYSFYNVPYAQPPVRELRFRDPVEAQPWKGIRKATVPREENICEQFSLFHHKIIGSEDCLYINIHTPQLPIQGEFLKPVVVFIHPGGQTWGSIHPNGHGSPEFLMQHDVVYVTVGYRLNIFGFLNLNLEECAGNQGLKDIIMAFEWIRENIHAFNGDATNITAVGSSSGAVLVHLLLLSPVVNGLFHKAILMGQYVFNCLVPYCEDQLTRAFEFACHLGYKGNKVEPKKLLKYFKRKPAKELVEKMKDFELEMEEKQPTLKSYPGGPFKESLDLTVIPSPPRLLKSSTEQIPIIFGICENEGVRGFLDHERSKAMFENTFTNSYRQSAWGWLHNFTDEQILELNNEIDSFYEYKKYLPDDPVGLQKRIDISSDAAFSEVYDTLIDPISSNHPVYVYKFQYDSEIGMFKKLVSVFIKNKIKGTFHCDDVSYWAKQMEPQNIQSRKVINNFTRMLCSFAKTGNPNHEDIETEWKPTTTKNPCYLSIDEKLTLIDGKLNGERFEFWDRLKKKFSHNGTS